MKICLCLMLGYLLGSLSPSALIAKLKHKNLREHGTKNLGATNTSLIFGKKFGVVVMIFDIFKGFLAFKIPSLILPEVKWLSMASGLAAVIGHCFPFYLKFKGGKGLASFGGMILAYNPLLFAFLLVSTIVLLLIVNHSFIMPFYAAITFVIFVMIKEQSLPLILFAFLASLLLIIKHFGNMIKAIRGEDTKIRSYIKNK